MASSRPNPSTERSAGEKQAMSEVESGVARHYGAYDVLARIRAGLAEMGYGERIPPEALKAVDEFHIGGAEATTALLDRLEVRPDMRVLDIGSGIGGPARNIAARTGCRVTGVDLTPAFVEAAQVLSEMCGMSGQVRFHIGSATELPLPDRAFDLALLLHVGMNIPDKGGLFREARRVLRDGGAFAVYDVMEIGDGTLAYPVPWAETEDLSALTTPEAYRNAAERAGFVLIRQEDRSPIALEFFARIRAQAASAAPPPLGLHVLMGSTVKAKMANMIAAIEAGAIGPVEMIFRAA
jgi:SAM-dependent methyltransferase